MSELPRGWEACQLGDILDGIHAGKSVQCDERPPVGKELGLVKISAVTWGRFNEAESKTLLNDEGLDQRNRISKGDLLISRANTLELVGAPVIVHAVTKNLYLSDKVLRLELPDALKAWVLVCLKTRSGRKQIEALATGNQLSMRNISQDALRSIELPLPPMTEQKRIAQKLDELLAQVDTLKARIDTIPTLLKRFRHLILSSACSGRLTTEWREQQAGLHEEKGQSAVDLLDEAQRMKLDWSVSNCDHNEASRVARRADAYLPPIELDLTLPADWAWAHLEDAVLMVVDCHNKTAPYVDQGIPLVRTPNIRDGMMVHDDLRYVNAETYQRWSKRCQPVAGDIIFTREAPMGEAAIIPNGMKVCLGQRTMLIRPLISCFLREYVLISLLDPAFKARASEFAVGTGVKHYRVGDVSELLIAIPTLAEQTEIVRRVEQLFAFADQLEAKVATAKQRIDTLTQSILAKAFRGELVPQDPNEEPASVLLERICAQRAAAPKAKRGRRTQA